MLTPELDAARFDGDNLLVAWIIALCGSDTDAEHCVATLREDLERAADFKPEFAPAARERAARRAALTVCIAWKEGRVNLPF
jgi:hypothetical protein